MKNFRIAFLVLLAVVGLNSCNKDKAVSAPETAKTTFATYTNILTSFASDFDDELISSEESVLKSASLASCITVTVDKNTNGAFYPRVWTVDYLNQNCTLLSGNTKKGKIHVSLK